ncbi:transglycosylase SLT domain-containing protein [Streptomyces sp. ODS28]|uniref:transglycosylase SLT domain-containing protein n=1 Tax=Streptomyces sp. ODS28 TaxID=3136688 RepID=UPI0031E856BA
MFSTTGNTRLTKAQRYSAAGVAAAGAAALTVTLVPGVSSGADAHGAAKAQEAKPTTVHAKTVSYGGSDSFVPAQRTGADPQTGLVKAHTVAGGSVANRQAAVAEKQADDQKAAASRSAKRAAVKDYPDNLDGWIREARAIMKSQGIPGSYSGIKRNIIRESGGDPKAQNDWDINAQKGVPSKGLLQVIQPTFDHYHVKGTKKSLTDPVANIVAACNYAADRYGSMDNVDSAY